MDDNKGLLIIVSAALGFFGLLYLGIHLSGEQKLRCQVENKHRPAVEVSVLCGPVR